MVEFLYEVIQESNKYDCFVISLATSSVDEASIRLLAPTTWLRGVRVTRRDWHGKSIPHVGAVFCEFEFQRYQPRAALDSFLKGFDLVQIVSGGPAIANATRRLQSPVCINVATTIAHERASLHRELKGLRGIWSRLMTRSTTRIEKTALKHVAHVFALSVYTAELLSPVVEPTRLTLSPPGVNTQVFRPDGHYHTDGYILTVGRLSDPRKNVQLLFRAYQLLSQRMSDLPRLVLAGSQGPSDETWEKAREWGIEANIDFHQGLSQDELARLYREAALFVLASDEEGLGLVLLESMSSGVPVISTRCGGPETIVADRETGLLTPVGDAEALAKAMYELLVDPGLRKKLGRKARQIVDQHFSLRAAGERYLEVYDRLLCATYQSAASLQPKRRVQ